MEWYTLEETGMQSEHAKYVSNYEELFTHRTRGIPYREMLSPSGRGKQ